MTASPQTRNYLYGKGELEMLWEQVKEVNAAFFRIAGALGFGRVLEAFRAQLRSDLMEAALNGNSSVR